jgi:hypothetical protein
MPTVVLRHTREPRRRLTVVAMRNPPADESGRSMWSEACGEGSHHDCPHLLGHGTEFNPRRLRLESGVVLCKCACHSSCPANGTRMMVPEQTWRESCTCPGAQDRRAKLDRTDGRSRDSSQGHLEALYAVRARAAGMSREEIKDAYVAELHSRGLAVPAEPAFDGIVDAIACYNRLGAGLLGRSLAGLAKFFGDPPKSPR